MRRSAGFTLLELMMAMGLMAILSGALYASLSIAIRSRGRAEAATADAAMASAALGLLGGDLEAALLPRGILAGAFVGMGDAVSLHVQAPAPASEDGWGDVRGVAWLVARPEDGSPPRLVRRATRNLLAPETPEVMEEVVCRGVSALTIRYYDGTSWLEAWDSTTMGDALPFAVEVDIAFASGYRMTRVCEVPCAR